MSSRPANKRTGAEDPLLYYETRQRKKCNCCCICCSIIAAVIILLLVVAFLLTFVGFPLMFKKSPELQRAVIFPTSHLLPKDPEFLNFKKYDIAGARNIYIPENPDYFVRLGAWHLLPNALITDATKDDNFDYDGALSQADFPVVLHFHSAYVNRIESSKLYNVLREFFHVIAFDYRGYGDSTPITPSEEGLVEDAIEVYNWIRDKTSADIYFWGHDLGAAISTHATNKLQENDIVPMGLFLEAPFSSIRDQIEHFPLFKKLFSWMPWFKSTMIHPLEENGFLLETVRYVQKVDCPIMILHAKDDEVTPVSLSEMVYKYAELQDPAQGNTTYHTFQGSLGYGHFNIFEAPELPGYIRNHTKVCEAYKRQRE